MREDLLKRLAALNGGSLAEMPERKEEIANVGAPPVARPTKNAAKAVPPPPVNGKTPDLSGLLPGYECEQAGHGRYYCIETRLHDDPEWRDLGERFRQGDHSALPASSRSRSRRTEHPPERLLFFDIETSGLGEAMVFLIGVMAWDGEHFVIRQLLARGHHEERAILAETADLFGKAGSLVSFNGRSFDYPFVRNRLLRHGLPPCPEPGHLDLLHHARRRWGGVYPDCRLQTLESHVCGRRRVGDIPSREIPAVYRRYTRDGDPRPLQPIVHHNLLDLITMADLMLALREG